MQSACTLVKKRPFVDSRISQPGYMECECCNPRSSLPCINIEKTWCLTVITLPASSWTTSRFGKEAGCKSCMTRPIQHELGVGFGSARLPVNTEPRLEFLSKLTQGSPYFLMLVVNLNKGCEITIKVAKSRFFIAPSANSSGRLSGFETNSIALGNTPMERLFLTIKPRSSRVPTDLVIVLI
jgi:hypothetical protein